MKRTKEELWGLFFVYLIIGDCPLFRKMASKVKMFGSC